VFARLAGLTPWINGYSETKQTQRTFHPPKANNIPARNENGEITRPPWWKGGVLLPSACGLRPSANLRLRLRRTFGFGLRFCTVLGNLLIEIKLGLPFPAARVLHLRREVSTVACHSGVATILRDARISFFSAESGGFSYPYFISTIFFDSEPLGVSIL